MVASQPEDPLRQGDPWNSQNAVPETPATRTMRTSPTASPVKPQVSVSSSSLLAPVNVTPSTSRKMTCAGFSGSPERIKCLAVKDHNGWKDSEWNDWWREPWNRWGAWHGSGYRGKDYDPPEQYGPRDLREHKNMYRKYRKILEVWRLNMDAEQFRQGGHEVSEELRLGSG